MTPVGLLLGVVALVAFILLEGRRQSRKLEREEGYQSRSSSSNLLGASMLELQGHLQADRDVKAMQIDLQQEDRHHPEYRPGESGDGVDDPTPPESELS